VVNSDWGFRCLGARTIEHRAPRIDRLSGKRPKLRPSATRNQRVASPLPVDFWIPMPQAVQHSPSYIHGQKVTSSEDIQNRRESGNRKSPLSLASNVANSITTWLELTHNR
jgi:hypothetical protein